MRTATGRQLQGSTSSPAGLSLGTGAGSVTAVLMSQGVAIQRHTPQGATRPFGSDTGSADDNTFVHVTIATPDAK